MTEVEAKSLPQPQAEQSLEPDVQKCVEALQAYTKMQGMLVIAANGDVLHSTFDYGKTQVYSALVRRVYSASEAQLVRQIDSTDGVHLLCITGGTRELLISPVGDKVLAVLSAASE